MKGISSTHRPLELARKSLVGLVLAAVCGGFVPMRPPAFGIHQTTNHADSAGRPRGRVTETELRHLVNSNPASVTLIEQQKPTRPPRVPGGVRPPTPAPTAAGQVIDFEDYSQGTVITAQYGTRGALFPNGAFLDTDQAARSGTRILRAASLVREFHPAPLRIEFNSAQSSVRLFAGTSLSTVPIPGTLRGFNAAGVQVAQDGPKNVAPKIFTTPFVVAARTASIVRVELQMAGDEFEAIDDLEIEAPSPGALPTAAPLVQFASPANNAELNLPSVAVAGTITGEGLLPNLVVSWQTPVPPGSTGLALSSRLTLTGTGTSRTFTFPWDYTRTAAPFGPVAITVEAENSSGLKASNTVRFTSFPTSIRNRYMTGGGAATFGEFRFGMRPSGGNCQVAVYERGAISAQGSSTLLVSGSILTKWLAVSEGSGYPGGLGCPTTEERTLGGSGSRVQDFAYARIYAGPRGTFYVPLVLKEAIDQTGNQIATAIPVEDPSKPLGVMETWLFQRFVFPTMTMEIRGPQGLPPKLYIEKMGGGSGPNATVVEVFPCDGSLGQCEFDRPLKEPSLTQQIDSQEIPVSTQSLGSFCKNTTWEGEGIPALKRVVAAWASNPSVPLPAAAWAAAELGRLSAILPPEWPAIADDADQVPSDYDQTSLKGVVNQTKRGTEDNPFNHTHYDSCVSGQLCASDHTLDATPFRGWKGTLGGLDFVHVEWEDFYGRVMTASQLEPLPGDLVFISGRWIVDCGHTWKTEIHPPSVLASMRNTRYEGRDATMANVWVTGWYSGDEPVEFLVYPPPRPSPRAVLRLVAPNPSQGDVTVTTAMGGNAVRLRVSAPVRRPEVTGPPWWSQSNMKWLDNPWREFRGRYWVLWSER